MFDKIAPYYDYFKQHRDYSAEAKQLSKVIKEHKASAQRVVELGCGTGSLMKQLLELGYTVIGIDESDGMLKAAAQKLPSETELHATTFDAYNLKQASDAVVWVDGAIGYVSPERIPDTLDHIAKASFDRDGILVIEPWYTRETWRAGHNHLITHQTPSGDVYTRLSHGYEDGSMDFHHLIATSEGVEHVTSTSRLWLHDYAEVVSHLGGLGLEVSFIESLPNFKRGLIVAS